MACGKKVFSVKNNLKQWKWSIVSCCIFFPSLFFSQNPQKVKIRRTEAGIRFFQTGIASDTIVAGKTDRFFFYVPDSLGCLLDLSIENAQLLKTKNDSIYRLQAVKGIKYLHWKCGEYKYAVDGTCTPSNIITIYIREKQSRSGSQEKILITNKFIIK